MISLSDYIFENLNENKINSHLDYLCKKYYFDRNRIEVSYFSGNKNINGTTSYKKTFGYGKAIINKEIISLKLNEDTLKNNDKKLIATLTHEFAHVLQRYFLSESEYSKLNTTKDNNIKFTSYSKSLLEIQAEAFCIFELGYSNNSFKGSKDMDDYKKYIDQFFNQFEIYN